MKDKPSKKPKKSAKSKKLKGYEKSTMSSKMHQSDCKI